MFSFTPTGLLTFTRASGKGGTGGKRVRKWRMSSIKTNQMAGPKSRERALVMLFSSLLSLNGVSEKHFSSGVFIVCFLLGEIGLSDG